MAEFEKLDVLGLAAHPDDVELACGGTICLLTKQGYRVGIADFTSGELGTRGTPELRRQEADEASRVMGLAARENLGMMDGDIQNTRVNQIRVIRVVRRYRPHIVLINSPEDRHPDHGDASRLSTSAMFYSGLRMIETFEDDGSRQMPWRPHHVLHYMQSTPFEPSFVVDVTPVWEQRLKAMYAFRSQFFDPDYVPPADEPQTFISNPEFMKYVESQARFYGYKIGAVYGEPFLYRHGPVGIDDLFATLRRERPFR